jgi:group I intron endonuclease
MIIYRAMCLVNGKPYYGKTTKTLEQRKKQHLNNCKQGKKNIFYSAIRKHGEKNFIWEIVDIASSKEELAKKELRLIQEFNVFKKNGYNHSMVSGMSTMSKEGKQKVSEIAKSRTGEKNHFFGKKHSKETIKIIIDKNKKSFSDIQQQFKKRGYELLLEEKDYKGIAKRVRCICPKGHEQTILAYTIFREDKMCLKCFQIKNKRSYEDLQQYFNNYGFNLLIKKNEYEDHKSLKKIKALCNNGHETEINISNFYSGHTKCKICHSLNPPKGFKQTEQTKKKQSEARQWDKQHNFIHFSQQQLDEIYTLYDNKNSINSIAKKFNVSCNVIKGRILRRSC